MVLAYIDESGSPHMNDESKIFSLTAILIKEEDFQQIDTIMSNFREQLVFEYQLNPDVEFHVKELLKNKKKDKMKKEFKRLTYEQRLEIYKKLLEIIEYLNLTIISVAIFKNELEAGKDPRFWANLMLIERLQMFVQELTRCDFLTIFMDDEGVWNKFKIDILKKAIYSKENPSYIEIRNIIPKIYFLKSKESMGIQIADNVAFCVRRWLRHICYGEGSEELDEINNICFKLIKNKFREYPDCLQKGLKIYPNDYLEIIKEKLV